MQAKAVATIQDNNERPFGVHDGAADVATYTATVQYTGDMDGVGHIEELKVYYTATRADINGLERFIGRIGDKEGSFVFNRKGKFDNGMLEGTWTVLENTGTGDFKGIRGQVDFVAAPGNEYPVTFNYYFE